jgi:hypothetical protein
MVILLFLILKLMYKPEAAAGSLKDKLPGI